MYPSGVSLAKLKETEKEKEDGPTTAEKSRSVLYVNYLSINTL